MLRGWIQWDFGIYFLISAHQKYLHKWKEMKTFFFHVSLCHFRCRNNSVSIQKKVTDWHKQVNLKFTVPKSATCCMAEQNNFKIAFKVRLWAHSENGHGIKSWRIFEDIFCPSSICSHYELIFLSIIASVS